MKVEDVFRLLTTRSRSCQPDTDAADISIQEHFRRMWNDPDVQNSTLTLTSEGRKSATESVAFRNQGNDAFRRSDYGSALLLYNKALLHAPTPEAAVDLQPLTLAFGNRSAALFHLEKYRECLEDVRNAIKYGHPEEKRSKLYQREASCFEALGDYSRALFAYKRAIAKCDKGDMLDTIQNKLSELSLKSESIKPIALNCSSNPIPWRTIPLIVDGSSSESSSLSSAVELKVNRERGRHFIAKRDIDPGQVILVEKPYSHILDLDKYLTHCTNCMRRCSVPWPCRSCSLIVYCSEKCENEALTSFHRMECSIMPFIVFHCQGSAFAASRSSSQQRNVVCLHSSIPGVMRLVLKAGGKQLHEQFVRENGKVAQRHEMSAGNGCLTSDSLQSVITSLTWNDCSRSDIQVQAALALKLLQVASFFYEPELKGGAFQASALHENDAGKMNNEDKPSSSNSQEMVEFEVYVGSILHLLQLISKHNTMGITESEIGEKIIPDCPVPIPHTSFGTCIGTGFFVPASMFNHSCYPNVSRTFHSTTGVFRSVRCIKQGEELVIAYNTQYELHPREYRRATLLKEFGFICSCQACQENWPMQQAMDHIRCLSCKSPMSLQLQHCPQCKSNITSKITSFLIAYQNFNKAFEELERTCNFNNAHLLSACIEFVKELDQHAILPCSLFPKAVQAMEYYYGVQGNFYDMRACKR